MKMDGVGRQSNTTDPLMGLAMQVMAGDRKTGLAVKMSMKNRDWILHPGFSVSFKKETQVCGDKFINFAILINNDKKRVES